ncbi:hypothetical protein [Desulfovibrio sp. JC010]|uniref:hypothetical protein n=1 Tax=Desulfovibrio sp. JC010 TaxID=2593641 RepID=UPI0013D24465|nr:hypothetical protein [Desulfovibrio sp. JC010]NDV28702.1 hypothetical protein [Desulfovibrio sp. JC010]
MQNAADLLSFSGIVCFLIAILHIVIIIAGPKAYRYFGAGEDLTSLAEKHSIIPPLLTAFIATVLAVFGLYAFSGAGEFARMPMLGPVLILIGAIFSLRGLVLPVQLFNLLRKPHKTDTKEIFFSLIALLTAICLLYGTFLNRDFIFQ